MTVPVNRYVWQPYQPDIIQQKNKNFIGYQKLPSFICLKQSTYARDSVSDRVGSKINCVSIGTVQILVQHFCLLTFTFYFFFKLVLFKYHTSTAVRVMFLDLCPWPNKQTRTRVTEVGIARNFDSSSATETRRIIGKTPEDVCRMLQYIINPSIVTITVSDGRISL